MEICSKFTGYIFVLRFFKVLDSHVRLWGTFQVFNPNRPVTGYFEHSHGSGGICRFFFSVLFCCGITWVSGASCHSACSCVSDSPTLLSSDCFQFISCQWNMTQVTHPEVKGWDVDTFLSFSHSVFTQCIHLWSYFGMETIVWKNS